MKRRVIAFLMGWILMTAHSNTGVLAAEPDPGLDVLQSTRSRPLFVKSRRAPEAAKQESEEATAPAAPVASPPNFTVTGVVTGAGKKIVIVVQPGDQKSVSLKIGDLIDDWRIVDIRPRNVVVERGTQTVELELPSPAQLKTKGESNSNN